MRNEDGIGKSTRPFIQIMLKLAVNEGGGGGGNAEV